MNIATLVFAFVSAVAAGVSAAVATIARRDSAKSADASARSAAVAEYERDSRRFLWEVLVLEGDSSFVLINRGTENAMKVSFTCIPDTSSEHVARRQGFVLPDTMEIAQDPIDIASGSSAIFNVLRTFDDNPLMIELHWSDKEGERYSQQLHLPVNTDYVSSTQQYLEEKPWNDRTDRLVAAIASIRRPFR